jgi:hypothetical protein
MFYGARGKEAPVDSRRIAPSTCQPLPENRDPERHLIPLLPAHGFIDRGAIKGPLNNDPIVYSGWKSLDGHKMRDCS